MTKNKPKLETRDWLIALAFIAIIATNWVWYQYAKTQDLNNRTDTQAWLAHQVEINKLKACVDENKKPCDINPEITDY